MRDVFRGRAWALLGAALAMPAAAAAELVETRMLEESLPVDGDEILVVVDNVFGSIHVTAHDEATVDMQATETIRGDAESDLERARAEVALKTERGDSRVAFLVRDEDDDDDCRCNDWDDGYVVEYDIELRVPRDAALDLSTVTDGEIVVDGVRGDFEIAHVNGPVTLRGLRGMGSARTVNGPLAVSFDRAPAGATSFKTLNGRLEVAFPPDLSADLAFETTHGEIWTDFEVEPVSLAPVSERTQDGDTTVIRIERRSAVRVASGGPTHSFATMNGDIHVRAVRP